MNKYRVVSRDISESLKKSCNDLKQDLDFCLKLNEGNKLNDTMNTNN